MRAGLTFQVLQLRAQRLAELVPTGGLPALASRLRTKIWHDSYSVVLRRDLSQPVIHPASPVGFSVRKLEPEDVASLFDLASPEDSAARRKLELWMKFNLESCYVSVLEDGRVTFLQWLLTSSVNKLLRIVSPGVPLVGPDSVLLEAAYTPRRFRRLPIMPAAMARIAEEGRGLGARWAVVIVPEDNDSMVKAARQAGFVPWQRRSNRRRLFRRFYQYSALRDAPG
jgi:hypothetical protein